MGTPDKTLVKETPYKMGALPTVKDLRQMAKSYGIKKYYKLNQYELISALNAVRDKPEPVPPQVELQVAQPAKPIITINSSKVKDLRQTAKWLGVYQYYKLRKADLIAAIHKTIEEHFTQFTAAMSKPRKTIIRRTSAINDSVKKYTIDGHNFVDPQEFYRKVKPQVISILNKSNETKVNFVTTCIMERVDMKTGEITTNTIPFRSKTVVNLQGTNKLELFRNAQDKMLESMSVFQLQGSNWRFKEVLNL